MSALTQVQRNRIRDVFGSSTIKQAKDDGTIGDQLLRILDLSDFQNRHILYDDFLGDVIEDGYSAAKGTDGQGVIATILAGGVGGVLRQISGDTVVVAESIASLTHGLQWRCSNGNLVLETRVKVDDITNVCMNIGFSDVLATTTLEEPFTVSGTTVTSNASNAVCFVFDTAQTTDAWYCLGVKADTDAPGNIITAVPPVAATYQTFRLELDANGTAKFYIDETLMATIENAVTNSTALTPIITVMARTTAVRTQDIDLLYCGMDRA